MATPTIGTHVVIATGGTPVQVFPAGINGGYIVNPYVAADQGIATAEVLYVDPVSATPGSTPGSGNGTASALVPGQSWVVPVYGSTLPVFANATTSGHRFTAVYW